jgi:hypothetical protein
MKEDKPSIRHNFDLRKRLGIFILLIGLLIFLLGAAPEWFGLDRSPVIGFVQISVFIFGLGVMCFGGFIVMDSLWYGQDKTIAADIGLRLMATGYVVSLASGLADVIGLGTRPFPYVPFFGPWQERGILLGEIVIIIGFLLMTPIPLWRKEPPEDEE